MDNQMLLKSSMFGGFKKKDVLSYIFELNESSQDSQQKLHEQLEEVTSERDGLITHLAEMETKLSTLQASLDEATAKLDSASRKSADASASVDSLTAQLSKCEQTLKQKLSELDKQVAINNELTEKNRLHEQKRGQVEQAASQISSLLNQAREDAAASLSQAKEKSESILGAAKAEAAKLVEAAKAEAAAFIDKAKITAEEYISSSKDSIVDTYKEFDQFLNETSMLQKALLDASAAVSVKMEALSSAVERARDTAAAKAGGSEANNPKAEAPVELNPRLEPAAEMDCAQAANEILNQYGIRKDDSGFFRLSSDK